MGWCHISDLTVINSEGGGTLFAQPGDQAKTEQLLSPCAGWVSFWITFSSKFLYFVLVREQVIEYFCFCIYRVCPVCFFHGLIYVYLRKTFFLFHLIPSYGILFQTCRRIRYLFHGTWASLVHSRPLWLYLFLLHSIYPMYDYCHNRIFLPSYFILPDYNFFLFLHLTTSFLSIACIRFSSAGLNIIWFLLFLLCLWWSPLI